MITAYSDASLNDLTGEAGLGVWLGGQCVGQLRHTTDIQRAELLAAQLALQLVPSGQAVRLHLDNDLVALDLQRGLSGLPTRFCETPSMLRGARERGLKVQVHLIPRKLNRAHHTARAARQGVVFAPAWHQDLRVRLRAHHGHLSVRWPAFHVRLPLVTLAEYPYLEGLLTAAENLPAHTTGLVRRCPPYARHLWLTPQDAPPALHPRLCKAQAALTQRGSRLRFEEGDHP